MSKARGLHAARIGEERTTSAERRLRLASRGLVFPSHRALRAELRAFEYGLVGRSGRAPMGARPGAHDDTVMGLAVFAAPESAPVPMASRVLLGSSLGGMLRMV